MIFRKRKKEEENAGLSVGERPFIVWLEIGVRDVKRAAGFYSEVFNVRAEVKNILGNEMALLERRKNEPGICLIERGIAGNQNSVRPVFKVDVMHLAVEKLQSLGGKIVKPPELLRQMNQKGEMLIGYNLIDEKLGYLAEAEDTEGNSILLYSNG